MREATKRGAPIEIEDFERRLRSQEPRRGSPGNPLRELARLMQSEEQVEAALRYARMFGEQNPVPAEEGRPDYSSRPAKRARGHEEAIRAAVPQAEANVQHAWREPPEPIGEDDLPPPLRGRLEYEDYESYTLDPARAAPIEDYAQDYHAGAAEDAHYHQRFQEEHGHADAHEHYAGEEAQAYAHHGADADVDLSEEALGRTQSGGDMNAAWEEETSQAPQGRGGGLKARLPLGGVKGRLRPWHGVAVAAIVAAGGIALALGHIKGKAGSRDIVTIAAPTGPVRVAPTATQEDGSASSQAPALDPQETAPVNKIEAHQEQPVEPVVTAPQRVERGLAPKRVKTLSIRAGVPVDAGAAPPAVERAASGPARPHAATTTTPKSSSHAATTAQAGKPQAHQKVAAAAPAADAAQADAEQTDAAASESSGKLAKGGFAVQFGAAASEAEARSMAAKVAQKYASQIGGRKPTFKMATVGDKTVYRVRVGGISKESAASVCSAVKASGGNCFVAGN
jgi:hypothetical protein